MGPSRKLINLDAIVRQKAGSGISVTDIPTQRPVFDSWPAHVGFVLYQVALGQEFLHVLQFYPVSITQQMPEFIFNLSTTDAIRS